MTEPEVTLQGVIDCQVCVPADWSDEQVVSFTETAYPCSTINGWHIRRAGDPDMGGAPERNPCAERSSFVHMVLDA